MCLDTQPWKAGPLLASLPRPWYLAWDVTYSQGSVNEVGLTDEGREAMWLPGKRLVWGWEAWGLALPQTSMGCEA